MNSRIAVFRRPTLPVLVRTRTGTEMLWVQQKIGDQYLLKSKVLLFILHAA